VSFVNLCCNNLKKSNFVAGSSFFDNLPKRVPSKSEFLLVRKHQSLFAHAIQSEENGSSCNTVNHRRTRLDIQFAKARMSSRALPIFRRGFPDFSRGAFQRVARVRESRGATSFASSSHDSGRQRQRRRSRGQNSITRSITGLPRVPTEATLVLRDGDRSLSLVEENERGVCPREPPGSSFSPSRNVILPRTPHVPSSVLVARFHHAGVPSLLLNARAYAHSVTSASTAIYANGELSAGGSIHFRDHRDSRKAERIFRRPRRAKLHVSRWMLC